VTRPPGTAPLGRMVDNTGTNYSSSSSTFQ
jgi:hypothetical protein